MLLLSAVLRPGAFSGFLVCMADVLLYTSVLLCSFFIIWFCYVLFCLLDLSLVFRCALVALCIDDSQPAG